MRRKFLWRKTLALFAGTAILVSGLTGITANAAIVDYDTIPESGLIYDFTDGAGSWEVNESTCTLTAENGVMKAVAKTNSYNDCAVKSGFIQVTPGATYEISFRAVSTDIEFTKETDRIYIRVRGYNIDKKQHIENENSEIYTSELFREAGVIRTTFTAKEKDDGIKRFVGFTGADAGETMVFDDVKIAKKSETERWTLMNETDGNTEFSTETDAEKGEVLHAYRRGIGAETNVGIAIRDISGLTAGKSYTLSYDLKTDNSDSGYVQELIWNACGYGETSSADYLYGPGWRNTDNKWKHYTLNFTALKDTVAVRFLIGSTGASFDKDYNAYIGNVSVTEYIPDAKAPYGGTLAGWLSDNGSPTISLDSEHSQDSDGYSAYFGTEISDGRKVNYRFAPYIGEGTYTLSYYMMTNTADTGNYNFNVAAYGNNNNAFWAASTDSYTTFGLSAEEKSALNNKWVLQTATITVPDGAYIDRLYFYFWGDAPIYLDNVRFEKDGVNYVANGNFCTSASAAHTNGIDGNFSGVVNGIGEDSDKGYLWLAPNGVTGAPQSTDLHLQSIELNNLTAENKYTLSLDVASTAENSRVIIELQGQGLYNRENFSALNGWEHITFEFTPSADTNYIYVYTSNLKWNTECVYIKNFSIKDSDGNEYVKNADFMSREASDKEYCDTPSFNPQTVVLRGDANVDGRIDIRDLVTLKKQLARSAEITAFYNSDVDNSKAVTASDLAALRQILLGERFVR